MKRVTAAVIIENGRLLVTRRPPGDPLEGLWELPGGKIEQGETPQACLQRELAEELDMRAEVGELLATTEYHYEHGSFEMLALATTRMSPFALRVHDAFEWVNTDDVGALPLAPADVELVRGLIEAGHWE